MRRTSWLLTLLLAAACSDSRSQADAQVAAGDDAEAGVTATQTAEPASGSADGEAVSAVLPWPEEAPPAFKALFAGSWAPRDPEGFDEQWIDEAALVETYTKRRAGRRLWRGLRSTDGVMPLDLLIRDREGPAVAYVYVLNYRRPENAFAAFDDVAYDDAPAVLHLRHRGRARVLFDGAVVLDLPAPPAGEVGQAQAVVTMTDGFDVVLVKVGRGSPELGHSMNFELRLSDPQGAPIAMQGWNTMRASDVPSELHAKTATGDNDG